MVHRVPAGCPSRKVRFAVIGNKPLVALIELASGSTLAPVPAVVPEPPPPLLCSHCGGRLIYRWTLRPDQRSP